MERNVGAASREVIRVKAGELLQKIESLWR
jgi:hypothetical protein